MKLTELVPPLELCKLIPEGEFADSAFLYIIRYGRNGKNFEYLVLREDYNWSKTKNCPAPTLQEILEELHKSQQDVFLKWSEIAYHEWLVNAYTHNSRDFQAHDKNLATAAMKVWLKMKGIEG